MSGLRWPVAASFPVTQGFGRPALRVEPTMYAQRNGGGWLKCRANKFTAGVRYDDVHPAVDIACPVGTDVFAVESGKVVAAGVYASTGEKYLMIRIHRDAKQQTLAFYTHLSRVTVAVGASVKRGQKVALSGNSGMSTGPHLHFEVRTGSVDLEPWTSTSNGSWYRWNPVRLKTGGDMADADFIKP